MLNHFLVVDLESTGPDTSSAEILTGHFLFCDSGLNVLDSYTLQVRPRVWGSQADRATEIHGITHAEAMRFTPFTQAINGLSYWLDTLEPSYFCAHANRTIFGKFSTYDYALLTTCMFDLGLQYSLYRAAPRNYIISTHSLSKYLNLGCDYNLKAIALHLGLGNFLHHNAEADTLICYEILKILIPQVNLEEFFLWENFKIKNEVINEKAPGVTKPAKRKPSKLSGNSTKLI